jgi:putative transposase
MTPEVSQALGQVVNHKRVARLMREHGLQSHKRRRFRVVTTDSKHAHPVAPNVLERDFKATAPDQKWLADMTYVGTDEGWLYVALVLDLYARKLVGWAMSETMPQELTLCALDVALGWRNPEAGLVHHSDRGSQYAAKDYRNKLKARGITVSMSRKGDCWDKAYVSHCTSFTRSKTTLGSRRLSDSFVPCALRGESASGGSNRHSFLSL